MSVKCLHCQSEVGEYDGMCSSCGYLSPGRSDAAHLLPGALVFSGAKTDQGKDVLDYDDED